MIRTRAPPVEGRPTGVVLTRFVTHDGRPRFVFCGLVPETAGVHASDVIGIGLLIAIVTPAAVGIGRAVRRAVQARDRR